MNLKISRESQKIQVNLKKSHEFQKIPVNLKKYHESQNIPVTGDLNRLPPLGHHQRLLKIRYWEGFRGTQIPPTRHPAIPRKLPLLLLNIRGGL